MSTELFEAGTRTETRYRLDSESAFDYYNHSARPSVAAFRDIAQQWFCRLPPQHHMELRQRFRSPKEANHQGAFFELYLHELVDRLGFELDPHPSVDKGTHPDFAVGKQGKTMFYLEATVAGLPSKKEQGEAARMGTVYDVLNRIESPISF